MYRFVTLAAVVVLASSNANCAGGNSANPLVPSAVDQAVSANEAIDAQARGGGKGGGKGGGSTGGGGSLSYFMVIDNNGNGAPNWGDTISFNWSTSATSEPTITLVCSQNGVDVYGATAGFYDSYPWPWKRNMGLWSGLWTSGAAQCTAKLHPLGASGTVLATQSFTVQE